MPEHAAEPLLMKTPYDSISAILKSVTARLDFRTEVDMPGFIKANKIETEKVVRAQKSVHFVLTIEWKVVEEIKSEDGSELDMDLAENWPLVQIDVHVCERKNTWTLRNCMLLTKQVCEFIAKDFERWFESKQQAMRNTQYGTARWASVEELEKNDFLASQVEAQRFVVGRYKVKDDYRFVTIPAADTERHGLVCGPTGCGKTATVFTPNLLERIDAAAIVTEATPGGKVPDLFSKTARFRLNHAHNIYYFNPDDPRSHCINPVDIVKTVSQAQDLADILIRNTTLNSHSGDQVWETAERQLLTALIMIVASQEGSLSDVRKMLLKGQKELKSIVSSMPEGIGKEECLGMFATSSEGFLNGVLVGLIVRLGPWLNPQIAALTSKTDFDLAELPKQLFTFYLAVPSGKRQVKPVAALVLNFLLDIMLEELRTKDRLPRPFMMLLDELTNFGYIPDLSTQLTIMRHAHVPMVLGMQDTEQLRKVYGMQDAKIILAQPATRLFFKPNELTTARDISQQLGRGTKHEQSANGQFRFYARDLMMPDEVMSFSKQHAICFLPEGKPIKVAKLMPELYDRLIVRDPPLKPPVEFSDDLVYPVETSQSIEMKKAAKKQAPGLFEEPKDFDQTLRQQNDKLEKNQGKLVRSRAKDIIKNLGITEADAKDKDDREMDKEKGQ